MGMGRMRVSDSQIERKGDRDRDREMYDENHRKTEREGIKD